MPEGAIFVSYAHEDLAAAKRMKTGLDVAGITVWFDMDRLGVGDDYDRKNSREYRPLQLLYTVDFRYHGAACRRLFPSRMALRA